MRSTSPAAAAQIKKGDMLRHQLKLDVDDEPDSESVPLREWPRGTDTFDLVAFKAKTPSPRSLTPFPLRAVRQPSPKGPAQPSPKAPAPAAHGKWLPELSGALVVPILDEVQKASERERSEGISHSAENATSGSSARYQSGRSSPSSATAVGGWCHGGAPHAVRQLRKSPKHQRPKKCSFAQDAEWIFFQDEFAISAMARRHVPIRDDGQEDRKGPSEMRASWSASGRVQKGPSYDSYDAYETLQRALSQSPALLTVPLGKPEGPVNPPTHSSDRDFMNKQFNKEYSFAPPVTLQQAAYQTAYQSAFGRSAKAAHESLH